GFGAQPRTATRTGLTATGPPPRAGDRRTTSAPGLARGPRPVSVLSAEEIKQLLRRGDLVVTPLLAPVLIDSGTIDIRLGRHFVTFRKSRFLGTDVLESVREAGNEATRSARADRLSIEVGRTVERVTVELGESFVLHPGQLVLACTLEYIALPATVGAQVLSRSTTGRRGIRSATATYFPPNFRGLPTLELA